ncbi:proline-rich receptor-like protein kinase PERK2 [Schistocerca americana]|uniref:proline-rich receptor-like protein kinase PERK2 n=1 Tax=Schistocerca americana TaxID=7009 RepID=UPI001F4F2C2E|nr:proline-rich receptor-like protein kinase PERK2 [Schistocerca americana]
MAKYKSDIFHTQPTTSARTSATTAPSTTPALTYASVAASAAAPQVVGFPSLTNPVASSSASPARITSRRATIATTEPAASPGASTTPQGSATRHLPLLPVPLPSSQPPVSKKPQKRVLTDSAPATSHKKSTPPPPPPAVTMDTTPPPATPTLAPTLHTFVLSTPDPKFLDARTLTKEIPTVSRKRVAGRRGPGARRCQTDAFLESHFATHNGSVVTSPVGGAGGDSGCSTPGIKVSCPTGPSTLSQAITLFVKQNVKN